MMWAVRDGSELPLGFGVNVGSLMEGVKELVLFICMGAEEASLALFLLKVEGLNGSGQALLLCDQAGNVIVHVLEPLELSCNSPILLGPWIVVHGSIGGILGEQVEEPVRELPFFIDGDVLRSKQLLAADWLTDTGSAQAVQAIVLDEGGKDMYGVISISDWEEEIWDVAFILFIPLWPLLLLVPVSKPFVVVCLPVFIGFLKTSCICLVLCQSLSSLLEYSQLFMVVTTDFFILSHNSCQSLGDVEEFFPAGGAVPFESSTYQSGEEQQLTEFLGGCHNLWGN